MVLFTKVFLFNTDRLGAVKRTVVQIKKKSFMLLMGIELNN